MIERALFVFVVFLFVSIVVEQFYAKRIRMGPGVELKNGVFVMSSSACSLGGSASAPGVTSSAASVTDLNLGIAG